MVSKNKDRLFIVNFYTLPNDHELFLRWYKGSFELVRRSLTGRRTEEIIYTDFNLVPAVHRGTEERNRVISNSISTTGRLVVIELS